MVAVSVKTWKLLIMFRDFYLKFNTQRLYTGWKEYGQSLESAKATIVWTKLKHLGIDQ